MDGADFPDTPQRDLLRFLTCGSVDDGKSTLIGRLLFETGQVHDDQLTALARESRRFGTTGEAPDYALLLDGLEAEREQGITIDVAYRYFSSPRRSFIVADTPGHEQYTRNMATGASTCDLAVILVDATKGLTPQTRRHSRIVSLFGVKQVVLAVNKMDLIDGDQAVFREIEETYLDFVQELGFSAITAIPTSARGGDNLARRSDLTRWYDGPTLLEALETAETATVSTSVPFRFPVQYVNRPNADFRGYSGTVAAGVVRAGDPIVVCPSGRSGTIARIVAWEGDRVSARAGDAVTLVLTEDIDVARGDVLAHPHNRPASVERLAGELLWLDETPLEPSRGYLVRIGTRVEPVRVSAIDGGDPGLAMNGIGPVILTLPTPVAFDAFHDSPATGSFILIDRETNATVAAGVARYPVSQTPNIHAAPSAVDRRDHERLNGHRGGAIWFTGLPGSGKTTLAGEVERRLHARGVRTVLLDGDNLRHGLNHGLGFSAADRAENVRRAGEVARLFADAGVVALCALVSPSQVQRDAVRLRFGDRPFLEVFVDASLATCRARDPKGLYARAAAGEIAEMTGVSAPYDIPGKPELILDTRRRSPGEAADQVIALLDATFGFQSGEGGGDQNAAVPAR